MCLRHASARRFLDVSSLNLAALSGAATFFRGTLSFPGSPVVPHMGAC
jgi:hypothetical protein